MNIQEYYRNAANMAFNGSMAALIPVIVVVLPLLIALPKKEFVLFAVPFLAYSFVSYQFYRVNLQRSIESSIEIGKSKDFIPSLHLFEVEHMLLTFLPSPSLRMLMYSPDGEFNGELADQNQTKIRWFLPYFVDRWFPSVYRLYDHKNELIVSFIKSGKYTVEVVGQNDEHLLTVKRSNKEGYLLIRGDQQKEWILNSEPFFTDVQIKDKGNLIIGRVRKGWMPVEWETHIKDVNTPVLSFGPSLGKLERLAIMAILVNIYRYRNH